MTWFVKPQVFILTGATYIGEVGRKFSERIIDHTGCNHKPHLYEHTEKTSHENVNLDHSEILSNGYKNNKFKRKLAEVLYIKHVRPTLNVQEPSKSKITTSQSYWSPKSRRPKA